MLILPRRINKSIQAGYKITVTFLEKKGTQVRIGISAPDDVTIHREEIYERIQTCLSGSDHLGSDLKLPTPAEA